MEIVYDFEYRGGNLFFIYKKTKYLSGFTSILHKSYLHHVPSVKVLEKDMLPEIWERLHT